MESPAYCKPLKLRTFSNKPVCAAMSTYQRRCKKRITDGSPFCRYHAEKEMKHDAELRVTA